MYSQFTDEPENDAFEIRLSLVLPIIVNKINSYRLKTPVASTSKGLFTRREGYPNKRVTL